MEMENVIAEVVFDFNPTDDIELTLKVCCGCCAIWRHQVLHVPPVMCQILFVLLWLELRFIAL